MREWKTYTKRIRHKGWSECNWKEFNLKEEPHPELAKQCFCEPEP